MRRLTVAGAAALTADWTGSGNSVTDIRPTAGQREHRGKSGRPAQRTIVFVLALFSTIGCLCARSTAAAPLSIRLWPAGPPGVNSTEAADNPMLTLYLPDKDSASGTAIVICPGGGYARLAMNYEGHEICQWLNSIGIAGIIVDYRHRGKGYTHPAPLRDAQRALRTIRARADEWKIRPNRIGVMGFSAGGHLASSAGTHFDPGDLTSDDPVEHV
ncbi:MAG: alpha/beta hydrolase, partial [Planctomycetaceae bacterium]